MKSIALKMLMGDRARFFGIVTGLTFAALLITQQLAIFLGFMQRAYSLLTDAPQVDVWVMHPELEFSEDLKRMPDSVLDAVRGVAGVEWAMPFHKGMHTATIENARMAPVTVHGIDDATLVGGPPEMVEGNLESIRQADAVVVDIEAARGQLAKRAPDGSIVPLAIGDELEINERRAVVAGICRISKPFFWNPVVFMPWSRVGRYQPATTRLLNFVMVRLAPGADAAAVSAEIGKRTGMAARTTAQFRRLMIQFVFERTGIAVNFGIAVVLGFLVGCAIAGQTFHNFTIDNLRHFAALKAMGTPNRRLLSMIVLQALTVGAIGWGLGVGLASLFGLATKGTELAFWFPWQLLLVSIGGVVLICVFSAFLSLRRVAAVDPAVVFRS